MRIDAQLAEAIARAAVERPYRQIDPMTTDKFVTWLGKRGIDIGRWQTLHHLWAVGVAHPILVDPEAIRDTPGVQAERFLAIMIADGDDQVETFVDLGQAIEEDVELAPPDYPASLQRSLHWHPFQLWFFKELDDVLQWRGAWGRLLSGPDAHARTHEERWRQRNKAVVTRAEVVSHASFMRLLALLLAVEPLVHTEVFPRFTLGSSFRVTERGTSSDAVSQYVSWRNSQVAFHELGAVGLTLDEAVAWHADLAFAAQICDPVVSFRKLLRHADRKAREGLKDKALLAHTLYDTAEVLRRYLERYHGQTLPEEPDVNRIPDPPRLNLQHYGNARPADFSRPVFRRITRKFGVDPGYRTVCFLEGATEVRFLKQWAKNRGISLDGVSVRLEDLRGKDSVTPDTFAEQLRRFREEEVFVIVCVDHDAPGRDANNATHIKKLREHQRSGLLVVDYKVWTPNFVEANFTIDEVVALVNALAQDFQHTLELSVEAIERDMRLYPDGGPRASPKTLESALESATQTAIGHKIPRKGASWGKSLADWAARNPVPAEKAEEDGLRPIDVVGRMLLRGRSADYQLTAQQRAASTDEVGMEGEESE